MGTPVSQRLFAIVRRFRRSNDGATAIETAMVLPMVIWLIMGILEMGIVFHIASLSNFAVNESARLGKTGALYGQTDREQVVYNSINRYLGSWVRQEGDLNLSTQSYGTFTDFNSAGTPGTGRGGDIVMYTVTYKWQVFTPILAQLVGEDGVFNITSRVLMKNENFD